MKPMLFNGEMVKAILEGRKTQTRRVVKPQPHNIELSGRWCWPIPKAKQLKGCCTEVVTASREWWEYLVAEQLRYQPGDILWVRETWRETGVLSKPYAYRADAPEGLMLFGEDGRKLQLDYKWKPSIHMPREAARLFLNVTGVRVERLQDITEASIIAEGIRGDFDIQTNVFKTPGYLFKRLWDSINGKNHFWASNPWVWVYEFERVEK